ncbi:hybrid sensor histidine kinase/response regulator [Burkholderia cepacia]|uniref:PAS domain-containing hybrid sensor histidine kinase/response regulator n=1 Tax=Burkholderia cepacia TaxID=292 RepID=UPI00075ADED3|nr:ATP-binding protein [Burkholderia cepacia]KVA56683.1 hybrid sensor histidine kinase/response regulator [Burkholderia cepacia]KVA67004.1 hybrid sensor histidine kinase/response regulator [Burkholderia cepacia]KVA80063.1 hybrid sensor histidine kinase/response regulator [Burkholderia cepacia]KVA92195.1 hybrid sensor histidine kinase/response regulator [Burkholderia cepacia]KVA96265.1 hybrid sensor histidine kinase/response regulator [Burkholderia cepacia]
MNRHDADPRSHPPPPSSPDARDLLHRFAEFRFQTVVGSITDYAVFMLDPHGNVATWNAGAERIKGYRAAEIVGQHFSRFYPPDAIATGRPSHGLDEAAARGHFEDEGWRVRKDGSQFWASVTITPVHDHDNQLCGFIKITRDMTERKRLEELEASTHRLSVFIAMLAHELRNHLAPLRHSVGILQNLADPAPALARCRDAVDRQVGQLTRLVDDLLDVGRITAGKVELDDRPVTVRDIVCRGVESIQPKLAARGQHIHVDLPPDAVLLHGDDARLVQVLHNLLDNASKFSPHGGRIDVGARTEGPVVAIRVSDQGVGIANGALETIFDLFEQEGAPGRRPSDGFGLGLAICRTFVELHGGRISAESAGPGRGATFTVRLPIDRMGRTERVCAPEPAAFAQPVATPLRIVVVDDNRDSADTLAVLLQMKGHAPRVAYRADEALALASDFVPHLMLVDLTMPDVDGFTLLYELRAIDALRDTTCVALSGHARASDLARTERAGFDDHLVKPVEMVVLDALLERVAQRIQRTP